MTSLNNLDKLIQIAMIEQMYSMLNKLKEDTINNKDYTFDRKEEQNSSECLNYKQNDEAISQMNIEIKNIKTEINKLQIAMETTHNPFLNDKENCNISSLKLSNATLSKDETYLQAKMDETNESLLKSNEKMEVFIVLIENFMLKVNKHFETYDTELKQMKSIIDNQTLIIQDFQKNASSQQLDDNHIILKIEEKHSVTDNKEVDEEQVDEEQVDEEQVDEEQEDEKEVDEEQEDEEQEQSEEEVGTEDEQPINTEKKEEVDKELDDEDEDEEEESEEVFEIEIDDIIYFATHEENGILYEATSDGDVGKKVGIIKDGEPIFH